MAYSWPRRSFRAFRTAVRKTAEASIFTFPMLFGGVLPQALFTPEGHTPPDQEYDVYGVTVPELPYDHPARFMPPAPLSRTERRRWAELVRQLR